MTEYETEDEIPKKKNEIKITPYTHNSMKITTNGQSSVYMSKK